MMKKLSHLLFFIGIAVTSFSQQQEDLYLEGVVLIQREQYQPAVQLFSQLIETDKYNVDFYLMRGKALYLKADYYEAINDLKEANKLTRNVADLQLAKCYARVDEEEKMYAHLELHLKSRYKLKESEIKFDPAFKKYHESDAWIDFWKNDWYSGRDYTISEVEYLIKYEKYNLALERINDEIKGNSRNHELYAARAKVYAALLNFPKAEKDFSRAIQLNSRTADYYKQRAEIYLELEQYSHAIKDLNEAIDLEPQNLNLLKQRSLAYQKNKNLEKAEEDIKKYLSYFPDEEDALFQCGNMYYDFERYLDALVYYNNCLDKNKTNAAYFEARGNTYYQVKTYKYAIRDYSMALDLNPESANAYLYKGLSRQAMGEARGACSDWEKAGRLGSRKAKELLINHCR